MRKIIALTLTAILVVNIFGYLISFNIQRYTIKEDVKRALEQPTHLNTQRFVFTIQEYRKLHLFDNGEELKIAGNMYDVVKKELKEGKVILTLYSDSKETGLLNELVSFFTEESQPVKHKYPIPAFSLLEFVFKISEWKSFLPVSSSVFLSILNQSPLSLALEIACPPPDTLFS